MALKNYDITNHKKRLRPLGLNKLRIPLTHKAHTFRMPYGTSVPFKPHANDPYKLISGANTCT